MNGEAITKRYEVKDLETGEVLDEPLYVLRPREDAFARSVMFGYAGLCGTEHPASMLVAMPAAQPYEDFGDDLRVLVEPGMNPAEGCISQSGDQFPSMADVGLGDGSMLRAVKLMESLGYRIATTIFAKVGEKEKEKAKRVVRALDDAEQMRELVKRAEREARETKAEELEASAREYRRMEREAEDDRASSEPTAAPE